MAPFSMKCTSCGEYIYRGRKFNARKETPDEKYLGIQIYRFYIRCTRCSSEITFKTDPKNQDYACERGATRNTEPWRQAVEETDEERLDRLEKEKEEEEKNAMVELEAKTVDAKREMAVADALDEIRTRNARLERADRDGVEVTVVRPEDEQRLREEQEDEEAARKAFAFARAQELLEEPMDDSDEPLSESSGTPSATFSNSNGDVGITAHTAAVNVPAAAPAKDMPPPPSFKRQVKKKKDHAALLGIKKKPSLV